MVNQKKWMSEQLQDKRFKGFLIAFVIIAILLTAEFFLLGHGIWKILRYLVLLSGMFIITWIDGNSKRIPNKLLAVLLGIRAVLLLAESIYFSGFGISILISAVFGGLLGGGMFLLVYFLSRGGIGMGDVKLFAVLGCYMGIGSLFLVVFLTVLCSSAYSIIMLIRKKVKLKEEIPFAPFVFVGLILTMALGG